MASKHDGSRDKTWTQPRDEDKPIVAEPYSGVSSFKHFDNTIVSAYDKGVSKYFNKPKLFKSKSISDLNISVKEINDDKPNNSRHVTPSLDTEVQPNSEYRKLPINHKDGLARIKRCPVSVVNSIPGYLRNEESVSFLDKLTSDEKRAESESDSHNCRIRSSREAHECEVNYVSTDIGTELHKQPVVHKPPNHVVDSSKQTLNGADNLKASRRKLPPVPKSKLGVPGIQMATSDKTTANESNCTNRKSSFVTVKKGPDKNDDFANVQKSENAEKTAVRNDYIRKIDPVLRTNYVLKMTSAEKESNLKLDQQEGGMIINKSLPKGPVTYSTKSEPLSSLKSDKTGECLVAQQKTPRTNLTYPASKDKENPDIFNFDKEIIQDLTDGIMAKAGCISWCQDHHNDNCDIDSGVSSDPSANVIDRKVKLTIEGASSSGSSDVCSPEYTACLCETHVVVPKNDGMMSKSDAVDSNDNLPTRTGDGTANTQFDKKCEERSDVMVPKESNDNSKNVSKSKTGVVRTPSYRRTVMARAKSRYSKKSNMLKECSCVRNEKGEIEECQFCQFMNRRSQTSLGHASSNDTTGENNCDKENALSEPRTTRRAHTPSGLSLGLDTPKSPRNVRKVHVSPRVDVLLRSDLFKKHLHKHEHLLNKHTKSYRHFGLQKSVSNLDLSEGYGNKQVIERSANEGESDTASEIEVNENLNLSMSYDGVSFAKHRPRRYSLTGDSDPDFEEFVRQENARSDRKRKQIYGTIPKSQSQPRSRPPIPFSRGTAASSMIPSFKEFKKQKELMREEEILKDSDPVQEKQPETSTPSRHRHRRQENKSKHTLSNADTNHQGIDPELINEKIDNAVTEELPHNTEPEEKSRRQMPIERHPSEARPHRRTKVRTKARTLSSIEMDGEFLGVSSGSESSQKSPRDQSRPGSKRPRSLISKKSSLIALIQDNEGNAESQAANTSNGQINGTRPKSRVGTSVTRSESDSKFETERAGNARAVLQHEERHSRHLSLTGKGNNSVTFKELNDSSQCSTQDVGESETSTSVAESLSDSIYSEVLADERSTQSTLFDRCDDLDLSDRIKLGKDDCMAPVLRSTSDVCEITPEAARKRRERKERPYKSDPFSGTEILPASRRCHLREERAKLRQIQQEGFSSSSKEEILSFLDSVVAGGLEPGDSFPSLEELNEDDEQSLLEFNHSSEGGRKARKHPSNVSSLSTDSGVIGQEGSRDSQESSPSSTIRHSHSEYRGKSWNNQINPRRSFSASCGDLTKHEFYECHDCGQSDQFDLHHVIQICPQCYKRRVERKKTIQEIIDTEVNYGRDLNILKEEFYVPMMKAGLLNQDQLDSIFLNLDELIHVNKHFISKLKVAINVCNQQNDEDLQSVRIGGLFLESSTMFLTFENYCVNQGQAPSLLEQFEKEKELLRIFLHVSQSENQHLRRMHLKSFLMVPVQRIMKYPLLLDRLNRTTFDSHPDKEALKEAKEKIEDILGNINAKSKTSNLKHRKSERHYSVTEKMEVSRIALETLRWNRKDACDVITSKLHVTQPLDHMWAAKRCKNYKFNTVHAVLLTLSPHQDSDKESSNVINNNNNNLNGGSTAISSSTVGSGNNTSDIDNNSNNNNNNSNSSFVDRVQSAAVVLIKEKNGKLQVMREPFMLDKCVVSQDPDFTEVFEIIEWNKESFLFKAHSQSETNQWIHNLRQQMKNLGCWRRRRNALPNILLNHLS